MSGSQPLHQRHQEEQIRETIDSEVSHYKRKSIKNAHGRCTCSLRDLDKLVKGQSRFREAEELRWAWESSERQKGCTQTIAWAMRMKGIRSGRDERAGFTQECMKGNKCYEGTSESCWGVCVLRWAGESYGRWQVKEAVGRAHKLLPGTQMWIAQGENRGDPYCCQEAMCRTSIVLHYKCVQWINGTSVALVPCSLILFTGVWHQQPVAGDCSEAQDLAVAWGGPDAQLRSSHGLRKL